VRKVGVLPEVRLRVPVSGVALHKLPGSLQGGMRYGRWNIQEEGPMDVLPQPPLELPLDLLRRVRLAREAPGVVILRR